MFTLTYDFWNSIIEEVVDAYATSLKAMQNVADSIQLSRYLVEELKSKGTKDLEGDNRQFLLTFEPYDDEIGGFKITLVMAESMDTFEKRVTDAVASHGFSWEDIKNFEAEHGMNLAYEILDRIEEEYAVYAENSEEDLVFELVIFDSEDIDYSSRMDNRARN